MQIKSIPEQAIEDLMDRIREFQVELTDDQEMGLLASSAGDIIHITSISSDGGQIIVFKGIDGQGRVSRLIQHYTQISVQLLAVDKLADEARRIGF